MTFWECVAWVSDTCQTYERQLWTAILAFSSGCVRVAVGVANNEPMPASMVFATLVSAVAWALTIGAPLAQALGLPTWAMPAEGLIIGLVGINLTKQVIAAKFNLPFLPKTDEKP